jgi:hypothetical protein
VIAFVCFCPFTGHQPSFFAKVNAVEGDAVEDAVAEKVGQLEEPPTV